MVAVELANLPKHVHKADASFEASAVSQADAADLLQVSRASVQRAAEVKREAPGLAEKVIAGEMTLGAAIESEVLKAGRPPTHGWRCRARWGRQPRRPSRPSMSMRRRQSPLRRETPAAPMRSAITCGVQFVVTSNGKAAFQRVLSRV